MITTRKTLGTVAILNLILLGGAGVLTADDTILVTRTEIQHHVYAGHLAMEVDAHPELEAGLLALLEMQRRNPPADRRALVNLVDQTLVKFRLGRGGISPWSHSRDEVLASCFEILAAEDGGRGQGG